MTEPNASQSDSIRPDEAETIMPRSRAPRLDEEETIPPRASPPPVRPDEAETLPPRGVPVMLAGRYRIVRQLGQGGMGSVWLAEDAKLDNRPVAVKMLPAVLAGKKSAYRQVKDEALMAMRLVHPNIAVVRAFEEDESGNPFLVMDYIDGTALDDLLDERGPLTPGEAVRLLAPIAAALDYAHSQGVVHRDVKPGNVIVRTGGTPFVLDFGIASEIRETMTRVTGKSSGGTLLYMSPEQLNGDAPKASHDVYSFAAMAYECLTGHPPFFRGGIEDQIKHKTPEPLPASIPSSLRHGIMAGLAKERSGRPPHCAGVLAFGLRAAQPGHDAFRPALAQPAMESPSADQGFPRLPESRPNPVPRPSIGRGWKVLLTILALTGILILMSSLVSLTASPRRNRLEAGRKDRAHADISSLRIAIGMYEVDTGRLPESLQNLVTRGNERNWHGPYLADGILPKDPWNNDYQYTVERFGHGFSVVSAGPDGAFGTEDDIR